MKDGDANEDEKNDEIDYKRLMVMFIKLLLFLCRYFFTEIMRMRDGDGVTW